MDLTLYPADQRGHADHGWLDTHHSFSFGSFYDAERIHFGALRVLNDDVILGGTGFGTHGHSDMEIISIPLDGSLEHADSAGHREKLRASEVQVMSAGTRIYHSEHNGSKEDATNFLQIWVEPRKAGGNPRYEQRGFQASEDGGYQLLVRPDADERGDSLWIRQDAYISRGRLAAGAQGVYTLHADAGAAGVYLFVIDGAILVEDVAVGRRDALAVTGASQLAHTTTQDADLLAIEVPLR